MISLIEVVEQMKRYSKAQGNKKEGFSLAFTHVFKLLHDMLVMQQISKSWQPLFRSGATYICVLIDKGEREEFSV